ncbi:hypothetical protein KO500_13690 [Cellulophaga baltica]|uniref:hypothetical protein n=1 Tax=Cellulophaga TaxID=104264 RepID=UPI001C07A063|nr:MULTISPECIES: hypothetical protein [Cellulophaga]MBU2997496.1 hypothetical protein [Cellulophaga baltica]MDO6768892.1 hypothetical protein [Cellulophaga sp. 1_MG-2023]
MQKLVILLILTFSFISSCKREKIKNIGSKNVDDSTIKNRYIKTVNDTIIKSPNVIFVMPNEEEIEILKKKHGEDNFYIIADDINFYMAGIVRDLKIKNIIFSSKSSYFFDEQNIKITKKDFKDPWFIIDYINGKPIKYSLVDYYSKVKKSSKSLSVFENNKDFFIEDIDVNNDGVLDKIVSSKPYKGNSLYLFCKKNDNYILALESVNFSEDGGNIIHNISQSKDDDEIFILHTVFPDGGNFQAFHYIKYNVPNIWKLDKTIYEKTDWQDSKTYICDVKQDVNMEEFLSGKGFNSIPENVNNNEMCKIKN